MSFSLRFSFLEEASILGSGVEPLVQFLEGDLAITILVELLKGSVEGLLIELIFATDFTVELVRNFSDLAAFEEFGAILVKGGEKLSYNTGKFFGSDRHIS